MLGAQRGSEPPPVETWVLPPGPGKDCKYTSGCPDSLEVSIWPAWSTALLPRARPTWIAVLPTMRPNARNENVLHWNEGPPISDSSLFRRPKQREVSGEARAQRERALRLTELKRPAEAKIDWTYDRYGRRHRE